MRKNVLIISGLDPSGGAGFVADVRVVAEHKQRAVGVITALTEQDTSGVRAVQVCNPDVVSAQLRALLSDIEVDGVKIGMLGDMRICEVVADALQLTSAPVVWDPVVMPTRGGVALFDGDVVAAADLLRDHLKLITPNLAEARALGAAELTNLAEVHVAARELRERIDAAVLITGGHLPGDEAIDVLAVPSGTRELKAPRLTRSGDVHGTGCALSTAIACGLAAEHRLVEAITDAKRFVSAKLANPVKPGRGSAAVL